MPFSQRAPKIHVLIMVYMAMEKAQESISHILHNNNNNNSNNNNNYDIMFALVSS